MRIVGAKDYDEMSRRAAGFVIAQVLQKVNSVLGLATGSSPIGLYKELVGWHERGDLSFKQCSAVNLDEYQGLAADNGQSYAWFMWENLFKHVDFYPENLHIPNGMAEDARVECARYDGLIWKLGGIDLQLLGLGHNGHIGFNEPGASFIAETHQVALSEATITANARFFDRSEVQPTHAFTMGMWGIMNAKKILMVVSGKEKAEILGRVINGPITPQVPGSILQLHPDVTIVADEAALGK